MYASEFSKGIINRKKVMMMTPIQSDTALMDCFKIYVHNDIIEYSSIMIHSDTRYRYIVILGTNNFFYSSISFSNLKDEIFMNIRYLIHDNIYYIGISSSERRLIGG
jgi:hypothetical protein